MFVPRPVDRSKKRAVSMTYGLMEGFLPQLSGSPERLSLAGGLLRSQISCVEGRRVITMRELKVQIGNSSLGITSEWPATLDQM